MSSATAPRSLAARSVVSTRSLAARADRRLPAVQEGVPLARARPAHCTIARRQLPAGSGDETSEQSAHRARLLECPVEGGREHQEGGNENDRPDDDCGCHVHAKLQSSAADPVRVYGFPAAERTRREQGARRRGTARQAACVHSQSSIRPNRPPWHSCARAALAAHIPLSSTSLVV